jgi:hypothetical protein
MKKLSIVYTRRSYYTNSYISSNMKFTVNQAIAYNSSKTPEN